MFEKEAQSYEEKAEFIEINDYGKKVYDSMDIQMAYQKGATFAYNKANEWHFVKDKDYPKDNKPVLCILGDIDSDNCEVGYYNDVMEDRVKLINICKESFIHIYNGF